jgi:ribosomal protein L19
MVGDKVQVQIITEQEKAHNFSGLLLKIYNLEPNSNILQVKILDVTLPYYVRITSSTISTLNVLNKSKQIYGKKNNIYKIMHNNRDKALMSL